MKITYSYIYIYIEREREREREREWLKITNGLPINEQLAENEIIISTSYQCESRMSNLHQHFADYQQSLLQKKKNQQSHEQYAILQFALLIN